MKQLYKSSPWLIMVFSLLLLATGCKSKQDSCVITPKLKKVLKDYGVGDSRNGLMQVTSKNDVMLDAAGKRFWSQGCVDMKGNVVIPLKYNRVILGDKVALVYNGVKWGALNLQGKELVPFEYDNAFLYGDYIQVNKNGLYGVLDKNGSVVIPVKYDRIVHFYENQLRHNYENKYEDVFLLKKDGKTTVVNLSRSLGTINEEHIETPYDYQVVEQDGKYGYVNYLGEEIPCQYQNARNYYSEGLAAVVKDNKIGFIDEHGTVKIPFNYYYSEFSFNFLMKKLGIFSDGLAAMINRDNKLGYIDKNGNTVIPFIYNDASCFHQGVALVGKYIDGQGRYGLIDKNNSVILPFEFEVGLYIDGAFEMCQNGKWGIYSLKGECLAPCQYEDRVLSFSGGYATVTKNGKQGLINNQGRLVIPIEYEFTCYEPWSKLVHVIKNGKKGYVDLSNRIVVPIEFDNACTRDHSCFIFVEKNGQHGICDRYGNCTLD